MLLADLTLFQLANLSPEDMKAVYNMRYLEAAPETTKSSSSAFSLKKVKIYMTLMSVDFHVE